MGVCDSTAREDIGLCKDMGQFEDMDGCEDIGLCKDMDRYENMVGVSIWVYVKTLVGLRIWVYEDMG